MSKQDSNIALLALDQQYDFEPGGQLPVALGDEIINGIAQLMGKYSEIVLT